MFFYIKIGSVLATYIVISIMGAVNIDICWLYKYPKATYQFVVLCTLPKLQL